MNKKENPRRLLDPLPPYGDKPVDFIWNTQGMIDAEKDKTHDNKK